MDKPIIKKNYLKYKILTDKGYIDFDGVSYNGIQKIYNILLENGLSLNVTDNHLIFKNYNETIKVKDLKAGDSILTSNGIEYIKEIKYLKEDKVYDILDVNGINRFYANDILIHNCQFIGKTGTLVDSNIIRTLLDKTKSISYKFLVDSDIRFYKELEPNMKYLISIDPSMGVNGDFAAIEVFEFPTFVQVAEWVDDKLNQNDQVEKLKNLVLWMYKSLKEKGSFNPEIYWSLENNSVGEGFICSLREKSINMNYTKPQDYIKKAILISEIGNKRIGFTTTKRTKTMACSQLKSLLETNRITINSNIFAKELSNFTLKEIGETASSKTGHDDTITSTLTIILMYLQNKNTLDLEKYKEEISEKKNLLDIYNQPFLIFSNN